MKNNGKLKVIAELGKNTDQHALLIELPKTVINGLNIATDGTVGTQEFLELMKQHCTKDNGVDWMKLIYGQEGAA